MVLVMCKLVNDWGGVKNNGVRVIGHGSRLLLMKKFDVSVDAMICHKF